MLQAKFRPLNGWPRQATPASERKVSPFRATYASTLDLLEVELNRIEAEDVTIYADVQPAEIRNDGWLRGGSKPRSSGLILTFESPAGKVSMPCDTYQDWQDNLRAIALSLEALRAVDRYGVTKRHEQYRGFRALAAPPAQMTRETAAQMLSTYTGAEYPATSLLRDRDQVKEAYRRAAAVHHPDRGGDRHTWEALNQARAVLLA